MGGLPDDAFTVAVYDAQGLGGTVRKAIACAGSGGGLTLSNPRPLAPTAAGNDGTFTVDVAGAIGPVDVAVFLANNVGAPNLGRVFAAQAVTTGANYQATGLPADNLIFYVFTPGTPLVLASLAFTVPAYVGPPAPGCPNPDADNYNPRANPPDATLCAFSPRLGIDTLPDLAALQGPGLSAILASNDIQWSPDPGTASATLTQLAPFVAGLTVTVNGFVFTCGAVAQPGRFQDLETLLDALLAVPTLSTQYRITASAAALSLVARVPGATGNLSVATSDAARLAVARTAGVNWLRSQQYPDWGCYVEVWVYRGLGYNQPVPTGMAAELAGTLESRYRDDNAYAFDLTSLLLPYTSQPDAAALSNAPATASDPSGLVAYFLRYGERYAQEAGGFRRARPAGQTAVVWAFNAVRVPLNLTARAALLTSRPLARPQRCQAGDPAPWVSYLAGYGASVGQALQFYDIKGLGSANTAAAPQPAAGVVEHRVGWLDGNPEAELALVLDGAAPPVPLLAAQAVPAGTGHGLLFANSDGGVDYFLCEGLREEIGKRTAATAASGRTAIYTRQAQLPAAFRLHTGGLDADTYAWLRREMGNLSSLWVCIGGVPVPHNLTALADAADEVKGEYSLALDFEPCDQPALGLNR